MGRGRISLEELLKITPESERRNVGAQLFTASGLRIPRMDPQAESVLALRRKRQEPDWEELLLAQMLHAGLPTPQREFKFALPRRWRFDFAYPELLIGLEVEGGIYRGKSRHTTGSGYADDCIKYNEAAILGWTVMRFTSTPIRARTAVPDIERAIRSRSAHGRSP